MPEGEWIPGADGVRRGMLRSAFAVGFITFLSRITGLMREFTYAYFLGTGTGADAFGVAVLLPNIFRRLVGEGAISSAFVPVFTRHIHKEGPAAVRAFAEKFFTLWMVLLIAITLLGMAFAGMAFLSIQGFVAWPPEKLVLTASLSRWLFPYLFVIGLSAVAGGVLNSFGNFALPSATPLFYNLAFIAAGWLLSGFFPGEQAVYSFTIGVLVGGALQLAVLIPPLWRMGIRFRPSWWGGHAGVREVLRLLIPGAFGAGVYQINVMVSSMIAMKISDEGAVAALRFSGRLMEVVLGIFVFALSTVSLTTLSRMAAAGDRDGFRSTLSEVIRLTGFITFPSAVGLYILREPVISVLLQYGRFDDRSALLTASAFQCYIPGLFLVGINRVLVSAFYSLKDIWFPLQVGVVNLVINAILSWVLIDPALGLGHIGIALASTLAAFLQAVCLIAGFARKERGFLAGREILASLVRSLASAVVMGAVALALLWIIPRGAGKPLLAVLLAAAILICGAVFFSVGIGLGARESASLTGALLARRRKR